MQSHNEDNPTFQFVKTMNNSNKMSGLRLHIHADGKRQIRLKSIEKGKSTATHTHISLAQEKDSSPLSKYTIKFAPKKSSSKPKSKTQSTGMKEKIHQLNAINKELQQLHLQIKNQFNALKEYVSRQIPLMIEKFVIELETRSAQLAQSLCQSKFMESSLSLQSFMCLQEPSNKIPHPQQWSQFRNTYIQSFKQITQKILLEMKKIPSSCDQCSEKEGWGDFSFKMKKLI